MRKRRVWLCGIIILLAPIFLYGQHRDEEKPDETKVEQSELKGQKKEDPTKLWVDLTGLIYAEWSYRTGFKYDGNSEWEKVGRWGFDATYPNPATPVPAWWAVQPVEPYNYSSKNNNSFSLQRCFLTLRKRIGEIFSVRITTDIDPSGQDFIYLRYAYIQVLKIFDTPPGPIELKGQFGKICTPVSGITDNLSDLRWIGQNYLDASNIVLNGNTFDNVSDFGFLASLSLFRWALFEYTLTNGEGFKSDNSETYDGKGHTLLVSMTPYTFLKELFINFYGRWEDTNKNITTTDASLTEITSYYRGIDKRLYYGCGIAWKSDLIKAGINFFAPEKYYSKKVYSSIYLTGTTTPLISPYENYTPRHKKKFYLIDSWVHINFGAVTPAGVIILGRCAYGTERASTLGNWRQSKSTLVLGCGAGYRFSEYFRVALYYEGIRYWVGTKIHNPAMKDPTPNSNVYLKTEVAF